MPGQCQKMEAYKPFILYISPFVGGSGEAGTFRSHNFDVGFGSGAEKGRTAFANSATVVTVRLVQLYAISVSGRCFG